MNSLVGYGVSSDSDSDDDGHSTRQEPCPNEPVRGRNFLLEADSGSASSDSEEAEERPLTENLSGAKRPRETLPSPKLLPGVNKLPPPSLQTCSDTSSVFTNPFKTQAQQKLCALQKHVPLTEQALPSHIGGRRVCVSYRKDGRCRFGITCKYAHDSDLQIQPTDCLVNTGGESRADYGEPRECQQDIDERAEGTRGTKKRVGLSNTVIPPKRALKQYAIQREKERGHI